jgi:hypothetical protein
VVEFLPTPELELFVVEFFFPTPELEFFKIEYSLAPESGIFQDRIFTGARVRNIINKSS